LYGLPQAISWPPENDFQYHFDDLTMTKQAMLLAAPAEKARRLVLGDQLAERSNFGGVFFGGQVEWRHCAKYRKLDRDQGIQ
jgi:hypothetical protein